MGTNQLLSLKEALLGALKRKLSIQDFVVLMLYENWVEICGETIGARTKPSSLKGNTLTIETENSALSFELGFIKEELSGKINRFLRSLKEETPARPPSVKEIRFICR